ncbi:hypothetical protein GCM10022226_51020 [Sphaerisporangium flaviroseum]|uniref:HTH luxR-type domain-containing protein n=1 Tax=Sphaerisporangium flaviroseum TaxID=509199 RepID=A0ABP7IQ81_9ACTN
MFDPGLAAALSAGPNPLSVRVRDVLAAADGSTIGDIASRFHLSEGAVRDYLSTAIQKTHTRNRREKPSNEPRPRVWARPGLTDRGRLAVRRQARPGRGAGDRSGARRRRAERRTEPAVPA